MSLLGDNGPLFYVLVMLWVHRAYVVRNTAGSSKPSTSSFLDLSLRRWGGTCLEVPLEECNRKNADTQNMLGLQAPIFTHSHSKPLRQVQMLDTYTLVWGRQSGLLPVHLAPFYSLASTGDKAVSATLSICRWCFSFPQWFWDSLRPSSHELLFSHLGGNSRYVPQSPTTKLSLGLRFC